MIPPCKDAQLSRRRAERKRRYLHESLIADDLHEDDFNLEQKASRLGPGMHRHATKSKLPPPSLAPPSPPPPDLAKLFDVGVDLKPPLPRHVRGVEDCHPRALARPRQIHLGGTQ